MQGIDPAVNRYVVDVELERWRSADHLERDMARYRLFGPDPAVVADLDWMELRLQALESLDGTSEHE